jgi:hypothetical protein
MVGFRNSLAVRPLLQLLGRSEAALDKVYEQATKGLSSLGNIAFNDLIDALNSPQETLTTQRVRLALRGISPFPYDMLLSKFKDSRGAVVRQVRQVFIESQHVSQTAPFLVNHLRDDKDTSDNVKQTLKEMQPGITMPHLVKALDKTSWQDVLVPLLVGCPEPTTVIPLLVNELGDAQRHEPAGDILLKFLFKLGLSPVLPLILPGLQDANARAYTRQLIVQMVDSYQRHHKTDLLPDIVNLFKQAVVLLEARTALRELLTHELAHVSLTALINGLQEQLLMEDCTLSLVELVKLPNRQQEVLEAVLQALRNPDKQRGAHITLVRCGPLAAERVCSLLTDNDKTMTEAERAVLYEEARSILAEMGAIAFPFIHKLAHDSQHRSDAREIFIRMSGSTAADGLLPLLRSNNIQEMEIAFYLLYMGIENEYRSGSFDMTRALLQQTQAQLDSDIRLRILAVLLFFNNSTQQRPKIAEHIINTIKNSREYHAEFMRSLLLLGNEAEQPLVNAIDTTTGLVQLEAIGTLGTLVAHSKIIGYVEALARSEIGTRTLDLSVQDRGFRALGGLLVNGTYNRDELRKRQQNSRDRTSSEFYSVLLGKRYLPEIDELKAHIQQRDTIIAGLNEQAQRLGESLNTAEQRANNAERRASAAAGRASAAEHRADAAEARASAAERRADNLQRENDRLRSGR